MLLLLPAAAPPAAAAPCCAGWLAGPLAAIGFSCVLAWPCLQVRVRTSHDRARDQLADLAVLNERLAGRAEGEAAQIRYVPPNLQTAAWMCL